MVGFILLTVLFDRCACFGFSSSFVVYLQYRLNYDIETADTYSLIWWGVNYGSAVVAAYLADNYMDRFHCVLVNNLTRILFSDYF